jgi:CheY-like chemotaxis protein
MGMALTLFRFKLRSDNIAKHFPTFNSWPCSGEQWPSSAMFHGWRGGSLMTKVLYVEDHEAQRDVMMQMLELYGYEVDVAYDGEEGVKKVREWRPDVVLMDIRLPGRIDGLVAIRQLRESPDTADVPIIVVSAWGSAQHKKRAMRAGADAHFTKPVSMDELIVAINRHLR